MNATDRRLDDLLAELSRFDVRLTPTGDGGLTIDAPEGTLTPDLIERLKTLKWDLIAQLANPAEASDEAGPLSEFETVEGWNGCSTCGSLDAWLPAAGDRFGRTSGRWRCSTCDPPEASRRMLAAAERIRDDEARRRKA